MDYLEDPTDLHTLFYLGERQIYVSPTALPGSCTDQVVSAARCSRAHGEPHPVNADDGAFRRRNHTDPVSVDKTVRGVERGRSLSACVRRGAMEVKVGITMLGRPLSVSIPTPQQFAAVEASRTST